MDDTGVWVIEDNRLFRETVAEVIEDSSGMRCTLRAASCEDALAALDSGERPDVVLMDIGLPGLDGIEGTRRIRGLSPTTRVVMLTVHETDDKVFSAICAGASGYLLKQGAVDDVVAAVREVCRGEAPINGAIARRVLERFARLAPLEPPTAEPRLTPREREILERLTAGLTKRQIAAELGVSFHTVDSHVRKVYDKLHVRTRAAAVTKALRDGLI